MSQSRLKGTLTALLFFACFGLNYCARKDRKSNHNFYENVETNEVTGFENESSKKEGFKVRLL